MISVSYEHKFIVSNSEKLQFRKYRLNLFLVYKTKACNHYLQALLSEIVLLLTESYTAGFNPW